MRRARNPLVVFAVAVVPLQVSGIAMAQFGGGGVGGAANYASGAVTREDFPQRWVPESEAQLLVPDTALTCISVLGTVELPVEPEGLRVVFAITSEGATPQLCEQKNAAQVAAVAKAWSALEVPEHDIVEDFINVVPVYEWRVTERDGAQVRVQQQNGFRMQSNLHLAVKAEKDAMAAIKAAFAQGVTEIVTFDYWSSRLNEAKSKAREKALAEAKKKATTLLSVFDTPPKVINVQESTNVFYPGSLYRTYTNVLEEEIRSSDDWRTIKAYRPKMTFYSGLDSRADERPTGPAMHPRIAVVSSVRLYYESPANKPAPGRARQ